MNKIETLFLENEYFWGGSSDYGINQPYDKNSKIEIDLSKMCGNQTASLYLSNKGRYIYSKNFFTIKFDLGKISVKGKNLFFGKCENSLKSAYLYCKNNFFPYKNKTKKLPPEFFTSAQWNTWMQFTYNPTQDNVLDYANNILKNGFTPGIIIIDEGWHTRYGLWEFDKAKFPDPKLMISKLHNLGFKVMLWVVPFYTADGKGYIDDNESFLYKGENTFKENKHLLRNNKNQYALLNWWNGFSFSYDLTTKNDKKLLNSKLNKLIKEYKVDGFKFDGGSVLGYSNSAMYNGILAKGKNNIKLNKAWNKFGIKYKFHEFKDSFNCGENICIQRLRDRNHEWGENGLKGLIPSALLSGLMGYPFICPDMIGSGVWTFRELFKNKFDSELFVRWAATSCLFPMMQFSWAPWEDLTLKELELVKNFAKIHNDFSNYIISEVDKSIKSGEPLMRSLEYEFPNCGYEKVSDEFLLGENLLVAPIIEKNKNERQVIIPKGNWKSLLDNKVYNKGEYRISADISKLIYFEKI